MEFTVAICTWNRSSLLDRTLQEMKRLLVPQGIEWELLVVNNNSTDNTDEVIAAHADALPIKRVFEPRPGLSNARNAAVEGASGEYVLWTDDDVLVDPHWIAGYTHAISRFPESTIFGGPISPWFEGVPPRWLDKNWLTVAHAYAVCDLGPAPIPLGEHVLPFGANYMIKAAAHRKYAYDPDLGRKGAGMVGYEESTLIKEMLRDGFTGTWVPEAKVRHFIPRARQSTTYLKRYFRGQGVYLARTEEKCTAPTLWGYPRWLVKSAFNSELRYLIHRLSVGPDIWLKDLMEAGVAWGKLGASGPAPRAAESEHRPSADAI